IPGLVLTGIYMAYVLVISIIRPSWVPALPPEARTLGSGVMSLLIALAAGIGVAYAAYLWLEPTHGANADILAASLAVVAIYVAALLDGSLGVTLRGRLAPQVVIVLLPPLALIFLVLGTIFLGIVTPAEGGAM